MNRANACLFATTLLALLPSTVGAQEARGLTAFEGHYEYRDGLTLHIVARNDELIAVIGEGKYALARAGADVFTNGSGDTIPFLRDGGARVVGFVEAQDTFARLSPGIPASVRQLFEPREPDANGNPSVYRYEAPARGEAGIRTGTAGPGTVPVEVAERLVQGVIDGTFPDVRSILVYHADALRIEEYFYGYGPERPHEMRSLTKTLIALLAGAAVDRGLLRPDEPVLERLGYATVANPDPRKSAITLTDLLAMRSGLACDDHDSASPGHEVRLYETDDWVKAFLDLPVVAEPGTVARYCSGGIHATGRMIELATGMPLPDFAHQVLFEPLGIRRSDWRWTFNPTREQRNEFGQIHLRPRDMLRLGLLIAEGGEWEGRHVLSAAWIDALTARQSRIDDSDYGLGVWHRWYNVPTSAGRRRVDTVMLSGNGGQKVYLVPSLDLIAVFTGGSFNAESPANVMMAHVLLPAMLSEGRTEGEGNSAASGSHTR